MAVLLNTAQQLRRFRETTRAIKADPSLAQSWLDRASFFHNQGYVILAVADAYKACKLAQSDHAMKLSRRLETPTSRNSQSEQAAAHVVTTAFADFDQYRLPLRPVAITCSEGWVLDTAAQVLGATSNVPQQNYPWMPSRGNVVSQEVQDFFQRKKLVLRPSTVLAHPDPNVLGVFRRRQYNIVTHIRPQSSLIEP